jgi:hypothetical protein
MRAPICLLCAVTLITPALGAELAGVTMPDSTTVDGKTLVLNGLGLREATFLKIDVYVAGLYLETKSSDAQAILGATTETKKIVMQFVRNVKQSKMEEAWREGFEKNAGDALAEFEERIGKFLGWIPAAKTGSTMGLTFLPGKGVQVEIDGAIQGSVPGDDFARLLLSIWLGPDPPNAGLKDGMLGRS